ncbi:MAG: PDZ domain-containing protein [Dokdonella sp.]|uniref:PDZ domain-containing protein n=1 Tax=Dokdonella sp. TaxID=2291710 RepID=UPI0032669591
MTISNGNNCAKPWVLAACAGALLLALSPFASADDSARVSAVASGAILRGTPGAGMDVQQRMRAELRAVMTELVEAGAFGDQPSQQISLAVETPGERVNTLGLLVDSAHAHRDGLHVFGVTPGGGAERIGLRAGDVVVAMNGHSLTDNANAASDLRRGVDLLPDGGVLAFDVRRGGRALALSGALTSVYLPPMRLTVGSGTQLASNAGVDMAAVATATSTGETTASTSGCGRISDFDSAPRQQKLHGAKIISIDGALPGPTGSSSYRVTAGSHTVKIGEQIESRYLSFNDRARMANDDYKTLRIDVPADTTVLVAARLNEDHRSDPRNGAYWDPVAWKQIPEGCR